MNNLVQHIEAIIFTSEKPVNASEITECLQKQDESITEEQVKQSIKIISEKFEAPEFAFSLIRSGGGYQFLTKEQYQETVALMLHHHAKRRLTNSALETLSIIAYKQPVTKTQIEQIRGVNSDYAVNKLMEKELVEIVGRGDEVGKPLLYGTSDFFMDYFGINSIDDLPKIKEFEEVENQIGNAPSIDLPSDN
ncbi:MAG: SMC-Scp complex subunit ScpB [Bacteroidetes bacterium]|nr:SMC-Scp complex subunit ScpB [Bacteroidota bacterium]